MTIEKEARELEKVVMQSSTKNHQGIIAKALQKKQDRIDELESALKEIIESLSFSFTVRLLLEEAVPIILENLDSVRERAKKAIGGGNG